MKSEKELLETAEKEGYFKESGVLYATPDGNIFLEKNKSDAYAHAKRLKSEVIVLKNSASKPVKADSELAAEADMNDEGKVILKKSKKNKS